MILYYFKKILAFGFVNMYNYYTNKFKEVIIMGLFDVSQAEKYFGDIVGKIKKNTLLKRVDKVEAQKLSGDSLVKHLTNKFDDIQIDLDNNKLKKLLGNSGIVYLLSTKPHTTSSSNFVKLVKNKVVNNVALQNYLINPSKEIPENIKNIRASLVRYLKLTDNENDDTVPDGETTETNQLKRNKNKDVAEKMQSRRKVNRLKVMTTALLIYLIEQVGSRKITLIESSNNAPETIKKETLIIPKGVTEIPNFWRQDSQNLCELTIPGHVKKIGRRAFHNCHNLERLTIKYGVETIEEGAFSYCTKLQAVTIPGSVKSLDSTFSHCDNLERVTIENGVETIGMGAFSNCRNLETLTIGNTVRKIDNGAFMFCFKLKSLNIPTSVEEIKDNAFWLCKSLETITIPSNVKKIGMLAFNECINLTTLIIENGVKEIDLAAFYRCGKLNKIVIPSSVETIRYTAFEGCPKNMEILGDASEETKNIIRKQIGAPPNKAV